MDSDTHEAVAVIVDDFRKGLTTEEDAVQYFRHVLRDLRDETTG